MPPARDIVMATANRGKLREFQRLLGEDWNLIPQTDLGISPVAETGTTFVDNAIIKARHAARETGLPAIADDSGLEVDALGGAPGVYSARFAGEDATDEANNRLLLDRLEGVPDARRTARFRCVVVFVESQSAEPLIAMDAWEGRIAHEPAGENGFGYDPLFLDPLAGCTSAQLPPAEKNARSHRGKAVRQLRALVEAAENR